MPAPSTSEGVILRRLLAQAAPATVSTFCFFAFSLTQLSVLGHLSVDALAAVAFAQMSMDFSTLVLVHGVVVATNSLCAQAFGARNSALVTQIGCAAATLLTVLCVPMALLWWHIGDLLLLAGVDATVAELSRVYARIWIAGLWPRTMFQSLAMFYQSQQIVVPTAVVNCVAVAANVLLVTTLTRGALGVPALGFVGCPIGTVVAQWLRFLGLVVYMEAVRKPKAPCSWRFTRSTFSRTALQRLLAASAPLAAGNLFENAQLQTMALFAASIGEVQLGTHMSMMELIFFATSPIYGLNDAAVALIGKHLGAKEASLARAVAIVSAKCLGVLQVTASSAMLIFRSPIPRFFSNDPDVIQSIRQVLVFAAVGYACLGFFSYACLVLESQTRMVPIMIAFLVGAWCVGVPTAYVLGLGFDHKSLLGIWTGLIAGYLVTASIGFYHAYFGTDWEEQATLAVERSKATTPAEAEADAV